MSGLRASRYLTLRSSAFLFIALHLGIRLVFPSPSIVADLVIFNLAGFLVALNAINTPTFNDYWGQWSLAIAFGLWSVGSTISSFNTFFNSSFLPGVTDICYSMFYPLVLFGLIRSLTARRRIKPLEIMDTLLIALGLTSMTAGFLLKPAMVHFDGSAPTVFLSILYPVGDIAILAITLTIYLLTRKSIRATLILLGIVVFTATDLLFLIMSATSSYPFGSLTDDGWIIGMAIFAEALYHHGGEFEFSTRMAAVATSAALLMSGVALYVASTSPGYLPKFILIPSFFTIGLTFLRMQFAIKDAKEASEERHQARTDDLTGLPNRRQFMSELALLNRKEGSVLLLDLDGFKPVNDSLGHEAGDELLKQVAIRFSRAIPTDVFLARIGGDEFGAIVLGDSRHGMDIARAINATLSYPITLRLESVDVGVSIGQAANDGQRIAPEELLARADAAMYEAKRSGSGIVQWDESLNENSAKNATFRRM